MTLTTSDGVELEAEVQLADAARASIVIAHPSPLMGGDMYTPVVAALWRTLPDLGLNGVRFNFRGVGRSTGSHAHGVGEQLDVLAAMERLDAAAPAVPILLSGWSFGADVSLAIGDDRVRGWFLAAAPLKVIDPLTMTAARSPAPKMFAVPENDQFCAPAATAEMTSDWTNATMTIIEDADHFFSGQMAALVGAFTAFVDATAPAIH